MIKSSPMFGSVPPSQLAVLFQSALAAALNVELAAGAAGLTKSPSAASAALTRIEGEVLIVCVSLVGFSCESLPCEFWFDKCLLVDDFGYIG